MQIHYFCTSLKSTEYSKYTKFCYRINNLINLFLFLPPSTSGNIIIIHFKLSITASKKRPEQEYTKAQIEVRNPLITKMRKIPGNNIVLE